MIELAEGVETRLVSDHMINLLQDVEGSLKNDKAEMIAMIDEYLGLPDRDRRMYQVARRRMRVSRPSDMQRLSDNEIDRFSQMVDSVEDPSEWDIRMNTMISRYI